MISLANCLFLDNSSTVCTALVFLVVKLLPYFAVHARTTLKENFPQYLAIMARVMCWKERPPVTENPLAKHDEEFERELYGESSRRLHVRPDLNWERLEMTFSVEPSLPPSSRQYFSILYYLYPSNVVRFIRTPVAYLEDHNLRSPYLESWAHAFDVQEIKRKSEVGAAALLVAILHPIYQSTPELCPRTHPPPFFDLEQRRTRNVQTSFLGQLRRRTYRQRGGNARHS